MLSGSVLFGLGLLLAGPPSASQRSAASVDIPELSAGIRRVEEGDLEGALLPLEAAVRRLAEVKAPGPVQARAHLYLAMAHLGLGALDAAREAMRAVWAHDPSLVLDPRDYAPPVVALHAAARPPSPAPALAAAAPAGPAPTRGRHLSALVGLGAVAAVTGVALSGGGAAAASPATPPPPEDLGPPTLRLFNCDDECRAFVNGVQVRTVGLALDSDRVDLTPYLHAGNNQIAFELYNVGAGITYGFEVRKGERLLFSEVCGVANRIGCEDNARYPPGPARHYVYILSQREERRERHLPGK